MVISETAGRYCRQYFEDFARVNTEGFTLFMCLKIHSESGSFLSKLFPTDFNLFISPAFLFPKDTQLVVLFFYMYAVRKVLLQLLP